MVCVKIRGDQNSSLQKNIKDELKPELQSADNSQVLWFQITVML